MGRFTTDSDCEDRWLGIVGRVYKRFRLFSDRWIEKVADTELISVDGLITKNTYKEAKTRKHKKLLVLPLFFFTFLLVFEQYIGATID